ncbi:hypothetical protein K0M31_014588 [Melipona bicolor]|uniref:Uncharacterized protein n=1 Tax=Melipona bicolor TaxID=60889 RepID=A0AA40KG24_9HYME|nr:hypothetical protein K0M31_014588 [Melipona bicolor]
MGFQGVSGRAWESPADSTTSPRSYDLGLRFLVTPLLARSSSPTSEISGLFQINGYAIGRKDREAQRCVEGCLVREHEV